MKITVICDIYGEENNGTVVAEMNLIRKLQSSGHQVNVVCCDEKMRGKEGYFVVKQLSLGLLNPIVRRNGVTFPKPEEGVVERAIVGADVVHLLLPFALSCCAVKICQKYGIPFTVGCHVQAENVTCHFGLKHVTLANDAVYRFCYRHVYRYADLIHYPTQFIRDEVEKIVGKTKGVVISNGVNPMFTPCVCEYREGETFRILCVGRLCSEKNQSVLLQAVARSKHKEKISVLFAGLGPDKNKIERLGNKLGVRFQISFFTRETLAAKMKEFHLYCHPAEVEIESIACLEAIASGLVPVLSDSKRSAANGFALDERSLFDNLNADSLAEKIDYWVEHNEERKAMSEKYALSAKKYRLEECMNKLEEAILSVVKK